MDSLAWGTAYALSPAAGTVLTAAYRQRAKGLAVLVPMQMKPSPCTRPWLHHERLPVELTVRLKVAYTGGNVRVSLPFGCSEASVDAFIEALPSVVGSIRGDALG